VEAAALVDQVRDPPAQQRPTERLEVGELAEQHRHVATPHRARLLVLVVNALRRSRREQSGDAPRDHLRFRLHSYARNVEQLRAGSIRSGRAEGRERVVGRERRLERFSGGGERAREEQVGEAHQRRAGPPRFAQHQPLRAAGEEPACVALRGGDVRPAELVDRLLAVADHDHRPVSSELLEDFDLGAAGVLELVDQQRAHPFALGRADHRVGCEQLAAEAGEIVEVQRSPPRLQLAVPPCRVSREGRRDRRPARRLARRRPR